MKEKRYVSCPKCGKKLFRIDENSIYNNIYLWCKKCCEEINIKKEPQSRTK